MATNTMLRFFTVVAVGLLACIAWLFEYGSETSSKWFEVVDGEVLRISGPEYEVRLALAEVLRSHQQITLNRDGDHSNESLCHNNRIWGEGAGSNELISPVRWSTISQVDTDGHLMEWDHIQSPNAPDLVFLRYDGEAGPEQLATEIAVKLEYLGFWRRGE